MIEFRFLFFFVVHGANVISSTVAEASTWSPHPALTRRLTLLPYYPITLLPYIDHEQNRESYGRCTLARLNEQNFSMARP